MLFRVKTCWEKAITVPELVQTIYLPFKCAKSFVMLSMANFTSIEFRDLYFLKLEADSTTWKKGFQITKALEF